MTNKTDIIAEPGKQELFIKREFDAPRELVFRAFTEPDLLAKWLGPRSLTMKSQQAANNEGEPWRQTFEDANGNEFSFYGVCHEISRPERLIRTFEFSGLPERGHVALETATFEEISGDRTRVTIQSVFKSVMDRDGMVQSGMEGGVNDSHERLDSLLNELQQGKGASSAA
jgi:uncharacterized protein YndB with AHSA1/START domain